LALLADVRRLPIAGLVLRLLGRLLGGPARADADQPRLVGDDDGLDAVTEAELGEDAGDVCLDGRLRQMEAGGEFGVAQPPGQQAEDFQLAWGERGEVAVAAVSLPRCANRCTRRRVMVGARRASPLRTVRTAAVNCSGVTSLRRKPLAPADRAA
jgi:hypothetical protein